MPAGKPVLEVLEGSGLYDVLFVVTRYFGGVLLGTGGLVRAYTSSAKLGLQEAQICDVSLKTVLTYELDYTYLSRVQNLEKEGGFKISDIGYEAKVKIKMILDEDHLEDLKNSLANITNGTGNVISIEKIVVKI